MQCPTLTANENERLNAIDEYGLGPGVHVKALDRVVDIAAKLFGLPIAAVNIVGSDQTFLSSQIGFGDVTGSSRDVSFCGHAIGQDGVMIVADALLEERFHDNPLVIDGIIRFYAGVPVRSSSGHALGALCVIDTQPHNEYGQETFDRLGHLARIVEDELELHRLRQTDVGQLSRLANVADMSPNAVICFDKAGLITVWNPAAAVMFGHEADLIVGKPVGSLVAKNEWERVHAGLRRVLDGGSPGSLAVELTAVRAAGERFAAELFWSAWGEGDRRQFGAIVKDLTERNREREALQYLTNYDQLTGFPNRHFLQMLLSQALEAGSAVALIVIDLLGFADANNTLGRGAGDKLLRIAGDRIRAAAPAKSIVGRIGFEQFAMLVTEPGPASNADVVAQHVNAIVSAPINLDSGDEIRLNTCCGIATASDNATAAEELMANADLALLQARQSRGICMFTPALRSAAVARRTFDVELHRAFDKNEFLLFYQPQVDLRSGALIGSEALIRWHHPIHGILPPSAFLAQLEASDLVVPVGTWVLKTACAQLASWRKIQPDLRISTNLSAEQFREGILPDVVTESLTTHGLPPEALELEITENIVLNQELQILPQLKTIRAAGISLSLTISEPDLHRSICCATIPLRA